jgi:hypothetical protein
MMRFAPLGAGTRLSATAVVVFFVCSDPKPDHEIAVLLCNSAIVIA